MRRALPACWLAVVAWGGEASAAGPARPVTRAEVFAEVLSRAPIGPCDGRPEDRKQLSDDLLNADCAYWELYAARQALLGREEALATARRTHRLIRAAVRAGRLTKTDEDLALRQCHLFQGQVADTYVVTSRPCSGPERGGGVGGMH
jgi:hypothetical protein